MIMVPDWPFFAKIAVNGWGTPVFVLLAQEIDRAVHQLESIEAPLPIRHWLSCKTLAVAPLLRRWQATNRGIEVVSPFELWAALKERFDTGKIVVNGTAKHRWLQAFDTLGLHIQLDSLLEVEAVAPLIAERQWKVGLRIHTDENRDPDNEQFFDHFGIAPVEIPQALEVLGRHNAAPCCISFHLRSHLQSVAPYLRALAEVAHACETNGLYPDYLDIGGGLPAPGESIAGVDGSTFNLMTMRGVYARVRELFPFTRELWLENGRFVSSRAGVLLIRVWDIKQRGDMRYLVCDGGRVNHAFPSDWQGHNITTIPERGGEEVATTICGPTCMAYDVLARTRLPSDIVPGDVLIWHNAGAYHLAWETRFSFGRAPIVWFDDNNTPQLVRPRESFQSWWSWS